MNFDLTRMVLAVPGFLLAITVHEYAHGYVAYRLGDPTAKLAGRLTFNPISHIDPIGALALILTQMIGWAKPVPVDTRYLRNPRRDMLWISVAGPGANLVSAVILAILLRGMLVFIGAPASQFSSLFLQPLCLIVLHAIIINVGLAVFNLIPIPPLDGAKVLEGMLPRQQAYQFSQLQPYGFIILMILIVSGATNHLLDPPIRLILAMLLPGVV